MGAAAVSLLSLAACSQSNTPTVNVPTATLSETAAAVAYWRDRHPSLRPAQIAARVGKSERQVRRILATLDDIEQPRRNGAPVTNLADAHR